MYADRMRGGFSPASLGLAVGINVALVGALLFVNPELIPGVVPDPPIKLIDVAPVPDPQPIPEPAAKPDPAPRTIDPITRTPPIVETPAAADAFTVPDGPPVTPYVGGVPGGTGTGVTVDPPAPPPPVIVGPQVDARYAGALQPVYPPGERRMGNEGRVVVRVLIGTDGRVKQVERVSATSDAFWRATQERALSRWRFVPGTRDGVAVEAWRTMSLTFVLNGD